VQQTALTAASLLAGLLILAAFLLYNRGDSKISTGTWVILALGDGLDFGSYFDMTGQDLLKNVVPFCFALGSVLTFLYALNRHRFTLPDRTDSVVIGLDLVITGLWLCPVFLTSTDANLAYQATTILAFWPMYRGLARGIEKETVLPWALWTLAYVLFLFTHLLSGGQWEEGVFPLVGLITHAIVLVFAIRTYREHQQRANPAL